jgi:2-aminoadipate transaminase
MKKFFPKNVDWIEPDGGMMIWVNLPDGYDPLAVQIRAAEKGVMISASPFFVPRGERINGFRLTYAAQPPDTIQKGIQILGGVLSRASAKTRQYQFRESERETRAVI